MTRKSDSSEQLPQHYLPGSDYMLSGIKHELVPIPEDAPQTSSSQTIKKQRKRRPDLNPHDDGYQWHKYGQKTLMDTTFVRAYYRCARKSSGCSARKMVDVHNGAVSTVRVTYDGEHNHSMLSKGPREVFVFRKDGFSIEPSQFSGPSSDCTFSSTSCIEVDDPKLPENEPLQMGTKFPPKVFTVFRGLQSQSSITSTGNSSWHMEVDKFLETGIVKSVEESCEPPPKKDKRSHSVQNDIQDVNLELSLSTPSCRSS